MVNTEGGTLISLPYQVNLFLRNWETCRLESREEIQTCAGRACEKMKRFKYITPEQAIYYQQKIVEETGGSIGLRDLGLLESALARPQATFGGQDLYPSVIDKASALFHSLIFNHPFLDGNKRTTLGVTYEFLKQNGYRLEASQRELIDFPLRVENKHLSLEEIAKWLEGHAKKV